MKITKRKSIVFGVTSVILFFSIVFILSHPTGVEQIKNMEYTLNGLPEDIVEYMNSNRITSNLSTEEMEKKFQKYFYNHYTSWEDGLDKISTNDKIKVIGSKEVFNPEDRFMYKETKEDVDYLFTNLKYGYAGYEYFGGDEKFNQAKSKILKKLKGSQDKFGKISGMDFNKILIDNLRFIKDGHFSINGMHPFKNTYAFMNQDEMILKDHNIFYIKEGNKKYPIISIEGDDPNHYIKPSIDEDGKIIYKIISLKDITNHSCDINITLKDQKEFQKKITLKKIASKTSLLGSRAYSFKEMEGIPVFKVSSFSTPLEKFSEDGLKYSDQKIAILDLRGNGGGSCVYGWKWISNFTNNDVTSVNLINASLITEVSKKRLLNTYKMSNIQQDLYKEYDMLRNSSDIMGWSKIITPKIEKFKNDKIIIVLFDKNSASASEGIISNLSYMENVIFIGTNSAGALNVTAPGTNILPNSKLMVVAGRDIGIEPDFIWRDGIGYFPDFWVEPKDALERTIKFINHYIEHRINI